MEQSSDNPTSNALSAGVNEASLTQAIVKSGYPLQIKVAAQLKPSFRIQEEWSYIDSQSQELRTLDLMAERPLYSADAHPRIRPHLNLLIECKQSDLPIVCFKSLSPPPMFEYPEIAGLRQTKVTVTTDDAPSSWTNSIQWLADLHETLFMQHPPRCLTLSKCHRKGTPDLELSGTEFYNGLVLPLLKGASHFVHAMRPSPTSKYFDAYLTIPIAVFDAPVVLVVLEHDVPKATMTPWARLIRHISREDERWWERSALRGIEIVHKDFLNEFIGSYVLPLAEQYAGFVRAHEQELVTGKGFISGMNQNSNEKLGERLRPP